MYLEISARQTGKTTRLLQSIVNNNMKKFIIVLNEKEVCRIKKLIYQLNNRFIDVITLNKFCENNFEYMRGKSWCAEYYYDEFAWQDPRLFKQFFVKYLNQGLSLDNIHLYTSPNDFLDLEKLQNIKYLALTDYFSPLQLALILNDFKYYMTVNIIDLNKYKMYDKKFFNLEILGNFIK